MGKLWTESINKHIDWGGDSNTENLPVSGKKVQEFIKDSLNKKSGAFYKDLTSNKYLIFSDEEDKNIYLRDTTQTGLIIGEIVIPSSLSELTDDVVKGKYLSLSGGTLKGISPHNQYVLTLNTDNEFLVGLRLQSKDGDKGSFEWSSEANAEISGIRIKNIITGDYLGLSDSGVPMYNTNTLLHSNNYSTYALSLGGGTLENTNSDILAINRINSTSPTTIMFKSSNKLLGRFGFSATSFQPVVQISGSYSGVYQTILHSGNYSLYSLPKTGGILSGNLYIGATDNTSYLYQMYRRGGHGFRINNTDANAYMVFGELDSAGTALTVEKMLEFGDAGFRYSSDGGTTYHALIHSGNVGEYAAKGLNIQTSSDNTRSLFSVWKGNTDTDGGDGYVMDFNWNSGNYKAQIYIDVDPTHKMALRQSGNSGTWNDWKTIAFTDSTVAAAYKLVTSAGEEAITVDDDGNLEVIGKQYLLGVGGYDGTNSSDALSVSEVIMPINTTYSELKELILNSKLIPGREYKFLFRSVVSSNYISDEQSFYLIVTAETENTISNKAKADRDNTAQNNTEAFNNSKFSEWEIWYDIDNNTDKYDWTVEGGLGVIYRMIDEYGNDVYYDFKNIRRRRDDGNTTYLFTQVGNRREEGSKRIFDIVAESIESSVLGYFRNNKVEFIYLNYKKYICSINIFNYSSTNNTIWNNTIAINCPVAEMPGDDIVVGVLGNDNYVNVAHGASGVLNGTFIEGDNNKLNGVAFCTVNGSYNTLGYSCSLVDIKGSFNIFGNHCNDIKIISRDTGVSRWAHFWKFGDNCQRLAFTSKSDSNTIYNVHVTDATGKYDQTFEYQIEPNKSTSEITNIYLDTTDNILKSYRGDRFGITSDDAIGAVKCEGFGVVRINFANNEFYMSNPTTGKMEPILVWMLNATLHQKIRGIGVYYVLEDGVPGYTSGNIFIDKTVNIPTLQFTAEGYTYTSIVEAPTGTLGFTKEKQLSGGEIIDITYQELVDIRAAKELVAGQQYRIIDYVTTTSQTDTQSAGHQFDIIVTADGESTLNEVARACLHEGDAYFTEAGANLSAWQIWYCVDNDTNKFTWADATNGRGVIYRMIDEFGNDCPYDFKNIQFARWELSNPVGYRNDVNADNIEETWIQESTPFDSLKIGFYGIGLKSFVYGLGRSGLHSYRRYKVEYTASGSPAYCYTFGKDIDYSLTGSSYGNVIKEYKDSSNRMGLNNIVFLSNLCFSNSFDYNCRSNSFGESCNNNSFGSNCYENSFNSTCQYNSFGNDCYYISFGSCVYNSFGDKCYRNSFGNYCSNNNFGSNCYENSFGNYCKYNNFGDDCQYNSFGNSCKYNNFCERCYNNNFGESCNNNSFGSNCYENSFGESKFNPKSYYNHIIFDSGNSYINLNCTSTTDYYNHFQNVRIGLGVNNTDTYKTIDVLTVNSNYEIKVANNSNGELKVYCEADLIA